MLEILVVKGMSSVNKMQGVEILWFPQRLWIMYLPLRGGFPKPPAMGVVFDFNHQVCMVDSHFLYTLRMLIFSISVCHFLSRARRKNAAVAIYSKVFQRNHRQKMTSYGANVMCGEYKTRLVISTSGGTLSAVQ